MFPYFKRKNKITSLGVLVHDLRPSTKNYALIDLGNKISKDDVDIDFYVFANDIVTPPHTINFPLLQQRNVWGFEGILISTDIYTTKVLLSIPDTCKKYYYVWDMLEWYELDTLDEILSIYESNKVSLIARSEDYSKILSNNFNSLPLIMEDFKYESIKKLCKL